MTPPSHLLDLLTERDRALIKEESRSAKPREACGLLLGRSGNFGETLVVACENRRDQNDWEISEEDTATWEDRGWIILGSWHSHFGEKADPSPADLRMATESGTPGIIYSLTCDTWAEFGTDNAKAPLEGRRFVYGVHDCASLVIDALEHYAGIQIPTPRRLPWLWWLKGENLYVEELLAAGFVKVPKAALKRLDVMVFVLESPLGIPNHAAVYLGDGQMIHHQHPRYSRIEVFHTQNGMFADAWYETYRHPSQL